MKKILLLLLLPVFVKGQLPNFNFAFGLGGGPGTASYGHSVAHDASGNVYVTGTYVDTVDVDPSPGVVKLISNGSYDIYLAKYNSAGQFLWAFGTGSPADDGVYKVCVDASGNVYITGWLQGTADFDPSAGTSTLTTDGSYDMFVAKYASNGQYQWAFGLGSTGNDWAQSIGVDPSGNILVTGLFEGTMDFNPAAGVNNLTAQGAADMFLAKYNSNGQYQWALGVGSASGNEYGLDVSVDASGDVAVTGFIQGISDFDPSASVANVNCSGVQDIFVAKYNSSGQYQWGFSVGNASANQGTGITKDGAGNFYVTGSFEGTMDFDPSPGISNLTSAGSAGTDIFLVKYNSLGQYQWGFNVGSTGNDESHGISIDAINNIYITGFFTGLADFDPGVTTNNLSPVGSNDAFLAKYNASGQYQWAFNIGTSPGSNGFGVDIDVAGNVFTTGVYNGNADFDPSLVNYNVTSSGGTDVYLAKYSALCAPLTFSFNTTNSPCPNTNGGSATVTVTGGTPPYLYDWGVAAGSQTTQVATNLYPGIYSILATDNNNCAFTSTVEIKTNTIPQPSICMVSVDSVGKNNVILWDKDQFAGADSFFVYRETSGNVYQILGGVKRSNIAYGEFLDTLRSLYPANGDPNVSTWRYKISMKDTCGNVSVKSPYHQTLKIIDLGGGTFQWPQHYLIEGQPAPVPGLSQYQGRRDNLNNGNWVNLTPVSSSAQQFTDLQYNTYSLTAVWRVETIWTTQCSSSYLKGEPSGTQSLIKRAKSNLSNNKLIGIKEIATGNVFSVYPNPSSDRVTIEPGSLNSEYTIILLNTLGQPVHEAKTTGKTNISLGHLAKGAYSLRIKTVNGVMNAKIVVE